MISEAVLVAVIGLCGSCVGSLFGVICSTKVTNYRIEQLENVNDIIADVEQALAKSQE